MQETMFVRPAAGLKIRMPERGFAHLPEEGQVVPLDQYWRARLRDGDVVAVPDSQPAPVKKPKA
ncbi:MAG: DUF2635 domain-containing protein [Hyphomicrobiaceae bacterium]